jgi:hypothetical protein
VPDFTFIIQTGVGGESFNFIKVQVEVECIAIKTGHCQVTTAGIQAVETWTTRTTVAVLDILGSCGVGRGLLELLELVSDHCLEIRDLRSLGFLVIESWVDRRISCWRVRIGVSLKVCSRSAVGLPLVVGSSCSGYQSFGISKMN